jgi:flavin reductase (DIM6/NTAB) family NADH-FMN oxidoreductase RutF
MGKIQADMKSCLQPMPKIIVSCRGLDGKNNALVVAYCCNCSYNPPMITVVDSILTGSHEMFVGKIEYMHTDRNVVHDKGHLDYSKIELI